MRAVGGRGYGGRPNWAADAPLEYVAVPFLENTILFERYEVRAYVDVAAKARECCRAVVSDFAAKAPYIRAVDVLREDGVTWVRQVPIERLAADFVTPEGMVQLFALASAHESSNAAFAAMHLDGRYWCMAREEWVLREDYQREQQRRGRMGGLCPVPLTVRGTQALVSFAPLAFKLFYAARHNAVLRRSSFPSP